MMETTNLKKNFLYDVVLPIIEKVAWLLSALGLAAKYNLVSAGNFMLLIGLTSLGIVYFLSAYKPVSMPTATTDEPYFEPTSSQNQQSNFSSTPETPSFLVNSICPKLIGIGGAVVLIGTLFKLMIWNGSVNMLMVGTGTVLIAVLLMALNQRLDRRAVVLMVLGSIMLYVPSETLIHQFHSDDPVLVEKMIYQLHHPRDPAASQAVQQHLQQTRAVR